ncbi:hypothetical protein EDD86DRAFT_245205 [Gorgonomyces haynaldii]|nr:hypothetical protein EDD86DRAFT_245205 [Gorgonomyces haynaldii]
MTEILVNPITNYSIGPAIPLSQLYKDQPCLFLLVRRLGCGLCREEAAKLSVLRSTIQKCGIRMIAVCKEYIRNEIEKFTPMFWVDEIVLDEKREMLKLLGVLGGLMILDQRGQMVYKFEEVEFGDHAPIDKVLEACKQLAPSSIRSELKMDEIVKNAEEKHMFHCDNACEIIRNSRQSSSAR